MCSRFLRRRRWGNLKKDDCFLPEGGGQQKGAGAPCGFSDVVWYGGQKRTVCFTVSYLIVEVYWISCLQGFPSFRPTGLKFCYCSGSNVNWLLTMETKSWLPTELFWIVFCTAFICVQRDGQQAPEGAHSRGQGWGHGGDRSPQGGRRGGRDGSPPGV